MVDIANDKLLTEKEVAERLRCHHSKIKRLKRTGKLAFIPGRPVHILESDLNAYIESMRVVKAGPEPGSPEALKAAEAAARARAMQKWLRRAMRAKSR